MFMTKEALQEMTRRQTGPAVARVLARLGIPFKLDDDDFPIVLASAAVLPFQPAAARKAAINLTALEDLRASTKGKSRRAA